VGPFDDVVAFAPSYWSVASGVGASAVSDVDGAADVGWDGSAVAADVEWLSGGSEDDGDDGGVAAHLA
jgi:hypothetical protein